MTRKDKILNLTKKVNCVRRKYNRVGFKSEELIEALHTERVPYCKEFLPKLLQAGRIQKEKDGYKFAKGNIHKDLVGQIYVNAQKKVMVYNHKSLSKKYQPITVEGAIKMLKENGYRVYAEVVDLKEI